MGRTHWEKNLTGSCRIGIAIRQSFSHVITFEYILMIYILTSFEFWDHISVSAYDRNIKYSQEYIGRNHSLDQTNYEGKLKFTPIDFARVRIGLTKYDPSSPNVTMLKNNQPIYRNFPKEWDKFQQKSSQSNFQSIHTFLMQKETDSLTDENKMVGESVKNVIYFPVQNQAKRQRNNDDAIENTRFGTLYNESTVSSYTDGDIRLKENQEMKVPLIIITLPKPRKRNISGNKEQLKSNKPNGSEIQPLCKLTLSSTVPEIRRHAAEIVNDKKRPNIKNVTQESQEMHNILSISNWKPVSRNGTPIYLKIGEDININNNQLPNNYDGTIQSSKISEYTNVNQKQQLNNFDIKVQSPEIQLSFINKTGFQNTESINPGKFNGNIIFPPIKPRVYRYSFQQTNFTPNINFENIQKDLLSHATQKRPEANRRNFTENSFEYDENKILKSHDFESNIKDKLNASYISFVYRTNIRSPSTQNRTERNQHQLHYFSKQRALHPETNKSYLRIEHPIPYSNVNEDNQNKYSALRSRNMKYNFSFDVTGDSSQKNGLTKNGIPPLKNISQEVDYRHSSSYNNNVKSFIRKPIMNSNPYEALRVLVNQMQPLSHTIEEHYNNYEDSNNHEAIQEKRTEHVTSRGPGYVLFSDEMARENSGQLNVNHFESGYKSHLTNNAFNSAKSRDTQLPNTSLFDSRYSSDSDNFKEYQTPQISTNAEPVNDDKPLAVYGINQDYVTKDDTYFSTKQNYDYQFSMEGNKPENTGSHASEYVQNRDIPSEEDVFYYDYPQQEFINKKYHPVRSLDLQHSSHNIPSDTADESKKDFSFNSGNSNEKSLISHKSYDFIRNTEPPRDSLQTPLHSYLENGDYNTSSFSETNLDLHSKKSFPSEALLLVLVAKEAARSKKLEDSTAQPDSDPHHLFKILSQNENVKLIVDSLKYAANATDEKSGTSYHDGVTY